MSLPNVDYVVKLGEGQRRTFVPQGAVEELWRYKGPEVMISGPYECGKTYGAMHKIHALATKYPNCYILLARKQYGSLLTSALQTYYKKVLPYPPGHTLCPVEVFGGGRPEWIRYPNGSTLVVAGLDVPEKVLSAEYDFAFIAQAEELTLHDWEQVLSRTTGRAGNAPYSQVIGDCNPGPPTHWILNRPSLKLLHATHKDNPTLWDEEKKEWTAQGHKSIGQLQTLTGLRYKRGFLGLWAGAEGQVYDTFDETVHVIDPFDIPKEWRRYRVIDFGYTHPFVCQWWAEDPEKRLYLYREIYMTGRTTQDHLDGMVQPDKSMGPGIRSLSAGERYKDAIICDHDAEGRAVLEKAGLRTVAAKKNIKEGIEAVQQRLRLQKDGKPRIFFFRDALVEEDDQLATLYKPTSTIDEFPGYTWRKMDNVKEVSDKDEVPVKLADHGLDCVRYVVMHVDDRYNNGTAQFVRYA